MAQDYQRDEFIRRFWAVRDPFPQTARNEFRESWEARTALALQQLGELTSDRARALLQFGPPSERKPVSCHEILRPLEVWVYREGSDRITGYFTLIFVGLQGGGRGPHHLWQPVEGLLPLLGPGLLAGQSET
ncbi:MAG: GWxTD domain-containing protein, partial [Thermoanaerobaculia bacterium]|nr:GWxTD domain-containing protein [Thermoanaerobaculia bacterium]